MLDSFNSLLAENTFRPDKQHQQQNKICTDITRTGRPVKARELLGDDHPDTLHSLNDMGGLLQNQGTKATKTAGSICLQSEGKPIQFRNVYLEPLD